MAAKKKNKFVVFNRKDLRGLPENLANALREISVFVNVTRRKRGSNTDQKYIVCNQDEPYAEMVWQMILMGEDVKAYELKEK